jgi:Flp pilus assembly protein TadG
MSMKKRITLSRREAGVALVEFALALPLLIMLLIGLIEFGRLTYFSIEIGNAAHAGAEYGSLNVQNGANYTGMQNAAIADGQNGIAAISATAKDVCSCWTGTAEVPNPPSTSVCGTACTVAGGRQVTYAQVTVTGIIKPLFRYGSLIPSQWTVVKTATIRVSPAQS